MADMFMEKCFLNVTNYYEMQNKATVKYYLILVRMAIIKTYDILTNVDTITYFTKTRWERKGWTNGVN